MDISSFLSARAALDEATRLKHDATQQHSRRRPHTSPSFAKTVNEMDACLKNEAADLNGPSVTRREAASPSTNPAKLLERPASSLLPEEAEAIEISAPRVLSRPKIFTSHFGGFTAPVRLPLTQEAIESAPHIPDALQRDIPVLDMQGGHWVRQVSPGQLDYVRSMVDDDPWRVPSGGEARSPPVADLDVITPVTDALPMLKRRPRLMDVLRRRVLRTGEWPDTKKLMRIAGSVQPVGDAEEEESWFVPGRSPVELARAFFDSRPADEVLERDQVDEPVAAAEDSNSLPVVFFETDATDEESSEPTFAQRRAILESKLKGQKPTFLREPLIDVENEEDVDATVFADEPQLGARRDTTEGTDDSLSNVADVGGVVASVTVKTPAPSLKSRLDPYRGLNVQFWPRSVLEDCGVPLPQRHLTELEAVSYGLASDKFNEQALALAAADRVIQSHAPPELERCDPADLVGRSLEAGLPRKDRSQVNPPESEYDLDALRSMFAHVDADDTFVEDSEPLLPIDRLLRCHQQYNLERTRVRHYEGMELDAQRSNVLQIDKDIPWNPCVAEAPDVAEIGGSESLDEQAFAARRSGQCSAVWRSEEIWTSASSRTCSGTLPMTASIPRHAPNLPKGNLGWRDFRLCGCTDWT